jgi:thioester reductase-like protein
MKHTYFITGYPGFIATELFHALYEQNPESKFYLMILEQEMENAKEKLTMKNENIHLIQGDITKANLGLSPEIRNELINSVTHCIHLAALYDLTIPYTPAYSCNVLGTEHVVQLMKECQLLERFCYFSTAYVSGNAKGKIYENQLITPASFRNHYEHTKFLAEQHVHALMNELPVTIIRPGIIVGDSLTGKTIKFDGPYFMMKFLKKIAIFPIPYIGKSRSFIHLVPIDFIRKATLFLLHDKGAESKTYHLICPDSPSVQEAYTSICRELNQKVPSWYLPRSLASYFLSFSLIAKWLGVPKEVLSYFSHDADYDTSQLSNDLKHSGIEFPQFKNYIKPVVKFFKENAANQSMNKY